MHPQVAGFIFVMCRLCPGPCPQGAVQGGMWLSQEWVSSLGQEDPKGGCRPSLLVEWWVLCMVQSSPVVLIIPWTWDSYSQWRIFPSLSTVSRLRHTRSLASPSCLVALFPIYPFSEGVPALYVESPIGLPILGFFSFILAS